MNTITLLFLIVMFLMASIGGRKGLYSSVGLFLTILIFMLYLRLIAGHSHLYSITFGAVILITSINLFFVNGWNPKMQAAFLSVMVLMVIILLVIPFLSRMYLQGFAEEELEELAIVSMDVPLDFSVLTTCIFLLGMLGALIDAAVAIASGISEHAQHQHSLSQKELRQFGYAVGSDILASTVNTLLFAFLGTSLGLVIWFFDLDYSVTQLLNSKAFLGEWTSLVLSGIGAVLILPITAVITAWCLKKFPEETEERL